MKKNLILPTSSIKKALNDLKLSGEKCLIVVNSNKKLLGTLSDGDIREAILNNHSLSDSIKNIYQKKCIYFYEKDLDIIKIKKIFTNKIISLIPVVNNNLKVIKTINWFDIFKDSEIPLVEKLNIPVVIMAGGKGTRLQPLTNILPKPLIPINQKTIIEHIIDRFLKYDIKLFFISINYKSLIIKAFFKELKNDYKVKFLEEDSPLGTAGSLSLLNNKIKKTFFVTNCDTIINANYNDFYNFHLKNKNDLTIMVSAKQFEIPYGTCELNENGLLKKLMKNLIMIY